MLMKAIDSVFCFSHGVWRKSECSAIVHALRLHNNNNNKNMAKVNKLTAGFFAPAVRLSCFCFVVSCTTPAIHSWRTGFVLALDVWTELHCLLSLFSCFRWNISSNLVGNRVQRYTYAEWTIGCRWRCTEYAAISDRQCFSHGSIIKV